MKLVTLAAVLMLAASPFTAIAQEIPEAAAEPPITTPAPETPVSLP